MLTNFIQKMWYFVDCYFQTSMLKTFCASNYEFQFMYHSPQTGQKIYKELSSDILEEMEGR